MNYDFYSYTCVQQYSAQRVNFHHIEGIDYLKICRSYFHFRYTQCKTLTTCLMDLFGWNGSIICAIKSYLSEYLFYRIRKQQLGEFHTDSEQCGSCVIKINQCKPWLVWKTSSYFNQHSWKLLTENCQTVLPNFKINKCCAYRFFFV